MTEDEIDRVELLERSVAAQERIATALETIAGKMPTPITGDFPFHPVNIGGAGAPSFFGNNGGFAGAAPAPACVPIALKSCEHCGTIFYVGEMHLCVAGPET